MRRFVVAAVLALLSGCTAQLIRIDEPHEVCVEVAEEQDFFLRPYVEGLMQRLPLPAPMMLHVYEIDGPFWGLTSWQEDGYILVEIDSRQPPTMMLDTLVHEWAHALLVFVPQEEDSHGPLWGVQYARAYRAAREVGAELELLHRGDDPVEESVGGEPTDDQPGAR